jgi:carbon monoxide dehydrogenase subunit G
MQVKLEKTFSIDAPAAAAWRVLRDIRAVAECMPGAGITEQIDDTHYKGQVKLRVGPASATFNGDLEVKSLDAGEMKMEMYGKGSDSGGGSAATMNLTAQVRDSGEGKSELTGASDVTVSGKLANFGGRMMTQVSDQILKQFGDNFTRRVLAQGEGEAAQQAAADVAKQPKELNALALMWGALVGFLKGLFGGAKSKDV